MPGRLAAARDDSVTRRVADRGATIDRIAATGVIAVVRLQSAESIVRVAEAMAEGGVDVVELTFTTPGALEALRAAVAELGDRVLLGAGTLLDRPTAEAAVSAGARFIVSPILRRDVVEAAHAGGAAAIPGAFSPTEIATAVEWGADLVKVFPAGVLGPRYLRDVLAPLPLLRLVPTGGIDLDSAGAFIAAGAVAVGVGTSLVDPRLVAAGAFDRLTDAARALRAAVDAARAARA